MQLSNHAKQRAEEMGLTEADVLHAIEEAEVDYVSGPRYGIDARIAKRGGISVAYNPIEGVVITVLYNTQEEYAR